MEVLDEHGDAGSGVGSADADGVELAAVAQGDLAGLVDPVGADPVVGVAGAVGVGNIMLIVVKERTREIGLRKALGATPASIVAMIMQESVFITAVAGYSGLVIGTLLIQGIAGIVAANGGKAGFFGMPEVEFGTALIALAVLVVSGVLASLMPAAKAAAVNPIVALQDE